jgi:hypothetical protein
LILHRQIVVWCAVVACAAPRVVSSQNNAQRWVGGLAADVGGVPDELSSRCGNGSGAAPMLGGGFSLLYHARSWLVLSTDTRFGTAFNYGCKLTIPGDVQVGPNQWASPVYRDLRSVPMAPLLRSALHVGVETPKGAPLLRVTGGSGWIWAGRPVPFATATVGLGSRGNVVRFYTEFEMSAARVRVNETQTFFHLDSANPPTHVIDSQRTTPVVLHPQWGALHIGVEVPRGSP